MRLRWWLSGQRDEDGPSDEWLRRHMQVPVPEGSFDRVWAQAAAETRAEATADYRVRELALRVQRLRWWTRALAGGLAAVTVALVLVLLGLGQPVASSGRGGEPVVLDAPAATRTASLLLDATVEAQDPYAGYGLLRDPRIVYGRSEARGGTP